MSRLGLTHCRWPGCQIRVPAGRWGCREHWYALPWQLRKPLIATVEPAQLAGGAPSQGWLEASDRARAWAEKQATEPNQEPLL